MTGNPRDESNDSPKPTGTSRVIMPERTSVSEGNQTASNTTQDGSRLWPWLFGGGTVFGVIAGGFLYSALHSWFFPPPAEVKPAQSGQALNTPQVEALRKEQQIAAVNGTAQKPYDPTQPVQLGPDGKPLPQTPNATGFGNKPIVTYPTNAQGVNANAQAVANRTTTVDPAVALASASRRAPIMGFSGGSLGRNTGYSQPAQSASVADNGTSNPPTNGIARGSLNPFLNQASTDKANPGDTDELARQSRHVSIETVRASIVPNRSFLLAAGTHVPCSLQSAIDSTQNGYVTCVINHDVYSFDGRIVLLDKGTQVLGQYEGGINQGQARMWILWTRALTPRGVAIDLSSPASDALGRSGVEGGVDSKFWPRFGAALMLSVVEGLQNAVSQHFAASGSTTGQAPSNVATTALQSTISIKPILRKNQGDQVAVQVVKDFDFSGVYNVRLKR